MTPVLSRVFALATCLLATAAARRSPNPEIFYNVDVDPVKQEIGVTMRITNAPRSVRLAMAVHPEYNDRFWRYVRDLRIVDPTESATLTQLAENQWRVDAKSGSATIAYRIQLPREDTTNRPSWHTGLRRDGGSINTTDTFLYLADFPRAPVDVRLNVPAQIARTDAATLLDNPILYGDNLHRWRFEIDGVPHAITYWPLPGAIPFDTVAFVDAIEKLARDAVTVFGKPPYPRYDFLLEDAAYGALEHKNSVTIGMPSRDLAKDPRAYLFELAHEFFHAWNLVRLYPEGRGVLSVDQPAHSTGLWLSEGVTMYYAEALTRRAGFPDDNLSRKDLLARQLEIYYERPGNTRISPELASTRAVDTTGINGDYEPNYYVQGRLIGTALDLILRDSTRGAKGLDDFMRAMYDRFAMKRGFTTNDVEHTANDVCSCNLHRFFDDHVRNARPLDFRPYLKTIGLSIAVDTVAGTDTAGTALPDMRIWAYPRASDRRMRVWIQDPSSAWARAGLHTGQDLVAFNGIQVDSFPDWRRAFRSVRLDADVPVDIISNGRPQRIVVHVPGFHRPVVTITEDRSVSRAQIERRKAWELGR